MSPLSHENDNNSSFLRKRGKRKKEGKLRAVKNISVLVGKCWDPSLQTAFLF
jgi:hypothetical protein